MIFYCANTAPSYIRTSCRSYSWQCSLTVWPSLPAAWVNAPAPRRDACQTADAAPAKQCSQSIVAFNACDTQILQSNIYIILFCLFLKTGVPGALLVFLKIHMVTPRELAHSLGAAWQD